MSKQWEEKQVSLGGAIIGCVATLVVGFFVGTSWHKFSPEFLSYLGIRTSSLSPLSSDWSGLDEVYNTLVANYDGEVDKATIIEGAKKGMASALGDVYTVYMDKEESEEYQAELHGDVGSGIGVEISQRDGYVRVIRTMPDNPARKAGVQAGDIIYKIDGEEVYSESTDAIASKLRGSDGTKVKLTIVRDGAEKTFELTREPINNVSLYVEYDSGTAIVKVNRFDTNTGSQFRDIVNKEFKKNNVKKVILDLRGNGGGYVSAAKDMLSLWIDGDVILTQTSKGEETKTYANRGQAALKDTPTVVLVNGTTASASEIVAGALKDTGKAKILGEQTFGKGVVQTLLNLNNNTLLKVTSAHWYTPNGTDINKEGIEPDIKVELTYDDANHNRDPQLDAAKKL